MSGKVRRAQVPFSEANKFINVNSFGSNVVLRWGGSYFEIDILGRNVPLPGVRKQIREKSARNNSECFLDNDTDNDLVLQDLDIVQTKETFPNQQEKLQRYRSKLKRRELRLLINQNFNPVAAQLVTATFDDCDIEYTVAIEHFKRFRQELQRKVKDIHYLSVVEPGEKRGYHLHMVTDRKLPQTPFEAKDYIANGVIKSRAGALTSLWPHGDIHQKTLDGGGNLGASLSRYLTKKAHCSEMKFRHSINKSSNLAPYVTMRGDDALGFIERFVTAKGISEFYSYTCENLEHIDYMHHYEFSLDPEKMLLCPKGTESEQRLKLIA